MQTFAAIVCISSTLFLTGSEEVGSAMAHANLKEVAAAAGVSVSTASRALAGKPTISPATRKRVMEAARELNYQPNIQARGLRTARTYSIGLAIPTLVNPFFATMAAAIQEKAAKEGLATVITSYSEDPEQLAQVISSLQQIKVDGMIVVPNPAVTKMLKEIASQGLPIVLIDRELPDAHLPTVSSLPQPGILAAVKHLTAQGHSRIGYLAGPDSLSTGQSRKEAFREACLETGIDAQFIYDGGFEVEEGVLGAQELLAKGITALIAGDSMMTLGTMQYCHDHGVRIGTDLALVGFDDLVYMQVQPAPISVIDQDVTALGHTAVKLLLEDLNQPRNSSPPIIRIPTTLIPRQSSTLTVPIRTTDFNKGGVLHDKAKH